MQKETGTVQVKRAFPEMLKGGVICDVVNAEQARIAEEAGASAVMALERVPADIRAQGGVARMSDPELIIQIKEAVTIPVMAKCRIGHFVEAAFVCGARDLGEALRRIGEGAAMIRTKGEAGTGNVIEAVRHMRAIMDGIRRLQTLPEEELMTEAKNLGAPYELVRDIARTGKLPVVNFSAGGVATPADAALMMRLGAEGIFVGSGIFKSGNPLVRAKAIVRATTHYQDPEILAEVSRNLGEPMVGINLDTLPERELMARRGW